MKNTLLLGAAGLALLMVFHFSQPAQVAVASSSVKPVMPTPKSLNDQINKHMQDMEVKKSFSRITAELAWEDAQVDMPETLPSEDPQAQVLDVSVQDTASRVYADLNPDAKGIRSALPSEKIQSKIAHKEWTKEYDHSLRKEYVHAFMDNMEKDGYQIKLNENLEVVAVEKKRKVINVNIDQAVEKAASVPR